MIDSSRIRWIFFDVGDTLLDEHESMSDWCRQMAAKLSRPGEMVAPAEVWNARQNAYTEHSTDILGRILELLAIENETSMPYDRSVFDAVKYDHSLERPFAGTTEVLRELSRRFSLGIIANQSAGTETRLCGHGWKGLFRVCVSSTEAGLKKPDPAIFQLALAEAKCSAENALTVGDRIDNDIFPAKRIGMQTIRIRQGMSRLQVALTADEEPDLTLDGIADLPQVLLASH